MFDSAADNRGGSTATQWSGQGVGPHVIAEPRRGLAWFGVTGLAARPGADINPNRDHLVGLDDVCSGLGQVRRPTALVESREFGESGAIRTGRPKRERTEASPVCTQGLFNLDGRANWCCGDRTALASR